MRRRRGPHRVGGALLGGAVLGASALLGPLSAAGAASARAVSSQAAKGIALDPAMFATGACMAFAPTRGNRHQTVFLDAGHGGIDPGGVGTTEDGSQIAESQINLPIELASMAILRAHGFRVVVSRTQDTTVLRLGPADVDDGLLSLQGAHDDVAARDECANLSKASALVGIYMDAGYESTNAGSIAAYDSDRPFAQSNLALATALQNAVLGAMEAAGGGIPNDGVQDDTGLGSSVGNPADGGLAAASAAYDHLMLLGPAETGYFTTPSTMPGALIEPLYLTDPYEGTLAQGASGQAVIAQGIAGAVEQFLAPPKAAHPATPA